jgi:pimeloyl-ACP methyl ester carboxylesterase
MDISLVQLDGARLFVRHRFSLRSRSTVIFIHGIGDSGLSFQEAFQFSDLESVNLIVPDLLGHGCSSDAVHDNYSFGSQIECLNRIVDEFDIPDFYLVGHSLGGDIATHFAKENIGRVKGFVNIEGNLTPGDVFTSARAVKADERGEFETWFKEDFMTKTVLEDWGKKKVSCLRYYASLWFCRPEAFRINAHEVCRQNLLMPGTSASITGLIFQQLSIPKIYCWGEKLSEDTKELIESSGIVDWGFREALHWPMIDEANKFYRKLAQFCSEQ